MLNIKPFLVALVALFLVACGLPRPGPTASELLAVDGADPNANVQLIVVDDDIIRGLRKPEDVTGFPAAFIDQTARNYENIFPGDIINVSIWENVDDGLFSSSQGAASGPAALEELEVDGGGWVFIPYVGRLKVAGFTTEAIRRRIVESLSDQTPNPQVSVRRTAGDGATVSVIGDVGAPGVVQLGRSSQQLSKMLATVGGTSIATEGPIRITVTRQGKSGTVWLDDLYSEPSLDVFLQPGDRIVVREDERSFTALGSFSAQVRVAFPSPELDLVEALGLIGGLNAASGDPRSLFVLRQKPTVPGSVAANTDASSRAIYIFDLTVPSGLFYAQRFAIRSDDIIYASEAPYTQFEKALSALTQASAGVTGLGVE